MGEPVSVPEPQPTEPGESEASRSPDQGRGYARLLARNLRAFALAQIAARVAGFAVVILLARELGKSDFGRYTVAIGVVAILTLFVELGMGGYIVREGARQPEFLGRILGHVQILRILLGVIAIGVALGLGLALDYDETTLIALLALAVASVFRVLGNSFAAVLQAVERARDAATVQAGQALAIAIAAALVVLLGAGLVSVSLAILVASALTPLGALLLLKRRWKERIEVTTKGIRKTLAVSAMFSASSGLHSILIYLDSVLVHAFRGNVETGLYGAAYRVLIGTLLVPAIYVDAATRTISYLARNDRERMARIYSRAVAHLTMLAVPLGIGGSILAEPIILLLYDEAYVPAAPALAILLPSAIFAIPVWVTAMTAYSLRLERRVAATWGVAVLGNALANVLLVPAVGIEAAAAATLAAEGFAMFTLTVLLRRNGVRAPVWPVFGKPLMAGAVMGLTVWPLRTLPILVPIAVGAVIYMGGLLLLKAFEPEDRELLRALLGRPTDALDTPTRV